MIPKTSLILAASIVISSSAPLFAHETESLTLNSLLDIHINSASKYAQTVSEAPSSVSIITSQDIQNYGYETLADVFASLKGFYTSYDRNYSYVGVRGFSRPTDYNNRILLQINGFSINENVFGSALIGTSFPINHESIERIEIIRGPGSSLYGTSAMFAVVNIVTKKANAINGTTLIPETGSYGRKKISLVYGTETDQNVDIMISGVAGDVEGGDVYYDEYDDPASNNGVAKGIDGNRYQNITTSVTIGDIGILGMYSNRDKEVPTASWDTDFNSYRNTTHDRNLLLGFTWDKNISNSQQMTLRSYYNRYEYEAGYPFFDDPETNAMFYDSALGSAYGSELLYTLDLNSYHRVIAGIEFRTVSEAEYTYWNDEDTWYDNNTPFDIFSGYLQDTYTIRDDLSLTAGMRYDKYSSYDGMLSPRFAVIYNPYYKTTIKMIYGHAFRIPNVYEAYYEEVDYWEKNNDLVEEHISTTELIWEQRMTNSLMSSVSVYRYDMKDMIDTIYDSKTDMYYYDNVDDVTAYGAEFGIDARFDKNRSMYANYSYQNAEDVQENIHLTNSPFHLVKFGITGPVYKRIVAAGELRYETERDTVYGTKTDDYILTNIKLSTDILHEHIGISLTIKNVFDIAYANPGGYEHAQDSIFQDGRNYILKAHISF